MGRGVARDSVQYIKDFKRQPLTGKVPPNFRDKAPMEPTRRESLRARPSCTPRAGSWGVASLFKDQGEQRCR